ncbi:MAG: SDR family oxidoreductase [Actinobacteria bacterium]|nr:SDR family oxidoreductase [Actinomycetota bacterium]
MNGQVAVVTGAASGMGRKVAERFVKAGAKVAITDVNQDALLEAERELRGIDGGEVRSHSGDIADPQTTEQVFDLAEGELGKVEILANVAGFSIRRTLATTSLEDWERSIAINLTGPFLTCRRFVKSLDGGEGTIVNVASVGGLVGMGYPAYCSAKMGLVGLTKMLATELAPAIRVNAVAPGPTATNFNAEIRDDETVVGMISDATVLKRWADPDELAAVVEFLASPASSYVTGHVLVADGGMSSTINLGADQERFSRAGE